MIFRGLPSPQQLVLSPPVTSSAVYDRRGAPLYYFQRDEHRIPVELAQVAQSAIDATLAVEDRHFFHHHGFSLSGITRAALRNVSSNAAAEGGSTITQQLVKNRLLTRDKRFTRKVRELILAVWVELAYSKKQILQMYLNSAPFGGTVYGIEAAAWRYFDKPAAALTVPESALLAGLLKAPSTYNPLGSQPELAIKRQQHVLQRMRSADFISPDQYEEYVDVEVPVTPGQVRIQAPHFVMYIRDLLTERFGEDRLYRDGLQVITTLDLELHSDTQQRLTEYVRSLFRYRVGNGAVLITVPGSGQILSMVGSADYFDDAIDGQVNVVMQYRQPGSAIKPLNYAMSLENGKTALSFINDAPVEFSIPGEDNYRPRNDDSRFHGEVTLRRALASSYNVPAVKELASNGVLNFIEKARDFGIDNWGEHNAYRYALTLGSGEVRMLDLAHLFGTFANYGELVALNPLMQVTDLQGNVLYENVCASRGEGCEGRAVFRAETAFLINSILSDNDARAPAFGSRSDLYIRGHEVAVKTGTTDYLRDNWAVGYTTNHVVAVWVGNNDGKPMRFIHSGSHGASTLWNAVTKGLLRNQPLHRFPIPPGIVRRSVCEETGTLACGSCPTVREEFFVQGSEPQTACQD